MKYAILILMFLAGSLHLLKAQSSDTICTSDNEKNSILYVFPNPTDGTFKIHYGSSTECPPAGWGGELLINIINANGITVFSETVHEFEGEYEKTVDLSAFGKGSYI